MKLKSHFIKSLTFFFAMALVGAAWPQQGPTEGIKSISPSSAANGDMNVLVTITLANRLAPPNRIEPLSVKIGALMGREIKRKRLKITATFDIPRSEPPGIKNLSVQFPKPSGRRKWAVLLTKLRAFEIRSVADPDPDSAKYILADTGQDICYNNASEISCPQMGEPFYGQDAQLQANVPSYRDNGDGTITDLNTGLMWQQDPGNKMSYEEAVAKASSFGLAGYTDWRLPTIKELYSLILFSGIDPSGWEGGDLSRLVPFLDTEYFDFQYGDESSGERIIDSQYATCTIYGSTTMGGNETMFGVNFADGRIKGYPINSAQGRKEKEYFVMHVRCNTDYGRNDLKDNGDGTVTDNATGLMWMQVDSGALGAGVNRDGRLNWEQALEWAENLEYAGFSDWRLPNAKELQSIVDYMRSPATTGSAAIDPMFSCTPIIDEGGGMNYPFYWTSTTHAGESRVPGGNAVYIAFGEALGFMEMPPNSGNRQLLDVHGAGAQRSDPKIGDPADWPYGRGPQGDVTRIYNFVRLVRGIPSARSAGL